MIPVTKAVAALLAQITAPGNLAPGGISSPRQPEEWKPSKGPSLSHFVRGGTSEIDYYLQRPSVQITAWADTAPQADILAMAVFAALNPGGEQLIQTSSGVVRMLWSRAQGFPTSLRDPNNGYNTTFCFYSFGLQL